MAKKSSIKKQTVKDGSDFFQRYADLMIAKNREFGDMIKYEFEKLTDDDSEYVFNDDAHGKCISVDNVMKILERTLSIAV